MGFWDLGFVTLRLATERISNLSPAEPHHKDKNLNNPKILKIISLDASEPHHFKYGIENHFRYDLIGLFCGTSAEIGSLHRRFLTILPFFA